MGLPMNFSLPLARYRFTGVATSDLRFPAYAGSTWRGAIGIALRRATCITHQQQCTSCLFQRSCVYSQLFETPVSQEPLLQKIPTAPHPYILHPLATSGRTYKAGDRFELSLTLMGKALVHLPYVIHAVQQAGLRGLGKKNGRFELLQVEQEQALGSQQWQTIYTPTQALHAQAGIIPPLPALPPLVQITFHTPYRSLQNGKLIHSGQFTFQGFITSLMRRISLLHSVHADTPLHTDFKALSQQAADIAFNAVSLRLYQWERYSHRQQAKIAMDGLIGSVELGSDGLAVFWPWLCLGQWAHAGKGAVMGLGEFRLQTHDSVYL